MINEPVSFLSLGYEILGYANAYFCTITYIFELTVSTEPRISQASLKAVVTMALKITVKDSKCAITVFYHNILVVQQNRVSDAILIQWVLQQ